MKTLNEKLIEATKGTRGNVKNSLTQLLNNGFTRTGKNQSRKNSCWTSEVVNILQSNKIPFEAGNDAVRGGITGEYVKLTSKAQLFQIKEAQRIEDEKELELQAVLNEKELELQAVLNEKISNKYHEVKDFINSNKSLIDEKLAELDVLKANNNQSEWHIKANALVQMVCKNDFQFIKWNDVYSMLRGK